jgi:hypothetical protein
MINIILVFVPIIFSVKYLIIHFKDRSLWLNVALLGLFSWALLDYCEAFYLSSFADYAIKEFLDQGHSLGEIIKYMVSASIATVLGFAVRRKMEYKVTSNYGSEDERWDNWLRLGKEKK